MVVAASTPHRAEAFDAARYCIDTLKHTVPIWKRETWAGGTDWSVCAYDIEDVGTMIPLGEAQAFVLGRLPAGMPSARPHRQCPGLRGRLAGVGHRAGSAVHELVEGRVRPPGR